MADTKLSPHPLDGLEATESACTAPTFSAFTINQRRWIIAVAAFAGMFSPMSSFIFYPAITSIADDLGVTVELVNLAITTYMVVSGLVPALLGNAADKFGRRPVYLLALTLYLAANLSLSLQRSYAGLLILRMLQSAGSSSKRPPNHLPPLALFLEVFN
jgi:MFS family permease